MSIHETQTNSSAVPAKVAFGPEKLNFFSEYVEIPKVEFIQLRWDANYWKSQHAQALEREAVLKEENEHLKGQVRDLKQRVFGRKTEKGGRKDNGPAMDKKPKNPRGQQEGAGGHGRTLPDLEIVDEFVDLPEDQQICGVCGAQHPLTTSTQDSHVVEVEVKGYIRRIRLRQHRRACQCEGSSRLVTAPPLNRLIPGGKHGISVWSEILLNKYLYMTPTNRLLQNWADLDITLSQGSVTGGLKSLKPLFEPLYQAVGEKVLSEKYWNVDETNYKVFVPIEGKSGYGWYLWVFRSESSVFYILDSSRSSKVPENFFSMDAEGILICDRYCVYKKIANNFVKIILAFCWAHVRRDFLDLGRSYPDLDPWCATWVERIGLLYHLNHLRLEAADNEEMFQEQNKKLRSHLSEMEKIRDQELEDESLHKKAGKVLESLKNHWKGLALFADDPKIPMDNNRAENAARGPKVGAKSYYGAGSEWSGKLASMMFSILMTVKYAGLNPRSWLNDYLDACAENGNRAPGDLKPFLPWSMEPQRAAAFKKSGLSPPAIE